MDPDPHWVGSLDPDPYWGKNAGSGSVCRPMRIRNTSGSPFPFVLCVCWYWHTQLSNWSSDLFGKPRKIYLKTWFFKMLATHRGCGRSQVIRLCEILVFYKSFNTLCLNPSPLKLYVILLQPRSSTLCSPCWFVMRPTFRIILIFLYLHQTFSIPCGIKGSTFLLCFVCKMVKKTALNIHNLNPVI